MRKILPLPRLLPLLAALSVLPLAAPGGVAAQVPETLTERVDRILAPYAGSDTPGALVAVVRNGEIVFERAYGMANLTHNVPLTVETRSNIGSTAKQFTAFAVALLAQEGQLSLDDDARTHLPELPDFGETVTLRHLLTHTSGYREFLNALAIGGWRIEDADHIDRSEIIRVVQRQPALQNSPGAEWNYNNTGYALLALVVERVTGDPFPTWMAAQVFEPLGMTETVIRQQAGQIVPRSTQGYVTIEGGGFREALPLGAVPGPGSVYTTLGDLARWMRNLRTAELGGPAVLEALATPFVLTTGEPTPYGLGLVMDRERGLRRIQHGGGDAGHVAHFAYYPELDAGIVVLVNRGGLPSAIPAQIAEAFFGDHMQPRATASAGEMGGHAPVDAAEPTVGDDFDPSSFDGFAGRYEMEIQPGFVLTFWRDGDRLMSRATGQPPFEIHPVSDSTFRVAAVGAKIAFHRDADGLVTSLTLHQGGEHRAHRLADADEPDLSSFTGRYYSSEFETYYTVAIEDEDLVLHHRRRDPVVLRHEGGDLFYGPFPFIRIEFERGNDGRVSGFRASNVRARDLRFERVE